MLATKVESFMAAVEEIKTLIPQHYEELALNKDKVPLSPDWNRYKVLEDAGMLLFISLRDDIKLVGYFIGIVVPHLHYTTCITCMMDILYVSQEHRNKRGGIMLMKELEKEAKQRGVHRIVLNTKCHSNISRLYKRFEYIHIEEIYSKWIGD